MPHIEFGHLIIVFLKLPVAVSQKEREQLLDTKSVSFSFISISLAKFMTAAST